MHKGKEVEFVTFNFKTQNYRIMSKRAQENQIEEGIEHIP